MNFERQFVVVTVAQAMSACLYVQIDSEVVMFVVLIVVFVTVLDTAAVQSETAPSAKVATWFPTVPA